MYETERLFLKPTDKDDAAFLFKLMNTPKWLHFIGDRKVTSVEIAKQYIELKMQEQFNKLGFGNYTLIRKSDGKKIGTCGLYDRKGIDGVDLGFALLPEHEKQGYAFESSTKLLDVGRKEFQLTKFSAITLEENVSSRELLERLNFEFHSTINISNDAEELMLYVRK
jgi:RimJ/RimL family protein N-acetyltransferase